MMIIYITICITLVALGLGIAALIKAGKRGPPGPPGGGGADGPDGPGGTTGGISPDDLDNAVTTAVGEQLPETYVKYGDPLNILDPNDQCLTATAVRNKNVHNWPDTAVNPSGICAFASFGAGDIYTSTAGQEFNSSIMFTPNIK
jgi:hypothetical protein